MHKHERIKNESLHNRIVSAEEEASRIKNSMSLVLSGFTRAGDAKAVPFALIERAKTETFKVNIFTGASLGSDIDKKFAEAGIVNKRLPFQADATMRKKINEGDMLFVDQHLSHTAEMLRADTIESIDFAVLEAIAITENGIIPTTSIGNSLAFAENADKIIIEIK